MPSVPVDPNPNQGLSPAVMARLVTAEIFKKDIYKLTNKVRLEKEALQIITNKKKLLAEDKEERLQKQNTARR